VRVLKRATQEEPAARYQTVKDFWDELNDVGMPVTQPLTTSAAAPRPRVSSELRTEEVLTLAAPPRPRFETSRELKQHEVSGNGVPRPRIVVPIAGSLAVHEFAALEGNRVTVPVAGPLARKSVAHPAPVGVVTKSRKRGRDFVVGLALVLCFAGLLAATGAYVRSLIKQRISQQPQTTTTSPDVGREAVTRTDVNLRAGPNRQTDVIGLAENGSRVQVLSISSSNSDWCEVQIIQHGRAKKDPSSLDRGWMNRTFLNFD
jgi:uncharacterized protein YgiM (DUF1202 family)